MRDASLDRRPRRRAGWLWATVCALALTACATATPLPPPPTATPPGPLTITVIADGQTRRYAIPQPLTVREALTQAGIAVGDLDRLTPAPFTRLTDGVVITLVRVTQTFEIEQTTVPFEVQTLKNENLPADSAPLILQPGANGEAEITYRTVFEDGIQVGRSVIKRVLLQAPTPQIIMVGIQKPTTTVPITGTLTYLSGGNAWAVRGNSRQRTPLTTTGDLDGRVFDLAADGQRLLFTRAVTDPAAAAFNSLWTLTLITPTAGITAPAALPLSLPVTNTLYAEWSPVDAVTRTIAFSTGEKVTSALGWQANNDVWLLRWTADPRVRRPEFQRDLILDASFAGLYGWWGSGFAFAPDGRRLAYAQTDAVGVVDLTTREKTELAPFPAYNLQSDTRAWYPTVRWSDAEWIFTVLHGGPLDQFELPEFATVFDLTALSADTRLAVPLVPRAGMFANPVPGPLGPAAGGQVALLLASDPKNPLLAPYRLAVMDRDGSNLRPIFPAAGEPGIEPGSLPAWSPDGRLIAIIYQGNLWLIDPLSGESQPLTGDGLTKLVEWSR